MAMSQREIKNVVVLAATGNIGIPILNALVEHPQQYNVTAVTRDKSKTTVPAGVNVVESDYSANSLRSIFKGADAVLSCVPKATFDIQKPYIDLSIESGVSRFLPSEYGLDSQDPRAPQFTAMMAEKQRLIRYLNERKDKISWTAVIIGNFFDWSLELPGLLAWDVKQAKAKIYDGGDVPYEMTNRKQIGRAVAKILDNEHVESTANQYVYINSLTATQNQVLAALERVTGKKFEMTSDTTSNLREKALERRKANPADGSAALDIIMAAVLTDGGINQYSKNAKGGLWNSRLGLETEDLETAIRDAIANV